MKKIQKIMGMDVVIEIVDKKVTLEIFERVFSYLHGVDARFSTYKPDSEISKINSGLLDVGACSREMQEIFDLSEQTRIETNNFFNIKNKNGKLDPSGLVKGLAIHNTANILRSSGYKNFLVDIGSDIEVSGENNDGNDWAIGIKNPFKPDKEIIKVVYLSNLGIATSGKYAKGEHIYNPNNFQDKLNTVVSVTVIASNAYEADRFATAVFAMGREGVRFLENKVGLEGYVVGMDGMATMTSGFSKYIQQ